MSNVRDRRVVTDRATGEEIETERYGVGKRWLARCRDEGGKDHTRAFSKKKEASDWLATETAKIVRGDWVDPQAGKVTLQRFYDDWSPNQVWLSNTRESAGLGMKMCTFADVPLRSLRRSHIEVWVKKMTTDLAPTTIDTRMTIVRGVLRAAVACAFGGLRKGEALGVQVWGRRLPPAALQVTRQLQRAKAEDVAARKNLVDAAGSVTVVVRPPKYGSERTVNLPDALVKLLAVQVAAQAPEGESDRWLSTAGGLPMHDNITDYRWRMTRKAAGLEPVDLHT
jgi:hypothetical protein